MDFTKLGYKDFKVQRRLGRGSQGNTYLATFIATKADYAIKKEEYFTDEDKQIVNAEIEQMRKLESRFTVKLFGVFEDRDEIFLVMELCSKGDLRKVISDLQKLPEKERVMQVWAILGQIIRSLNHLHCHSVVHRYIKPKNIFLMEDGSARLSDFGFAKEITEGGYATMAGTKVYMAAEIWLFNKADYNSDIFSVGIITQELLTGRHPFEAGTEQATIERIKVGKPDELPDFVPREMKELVTAMLSHDANKRPSTKQIMKQDTIKMYLRMQEEKEQPAEQQKKQKEKSKKKADKTKKNADNMADEVSSLKTQHIEQPTYSKASEPKQTTVKPKQQTISTQSKVTSQPKIIAQPPVTQLSISQVFKGPCLQDTQVDGDTFTNTSSMNVPTILFDPVIKKRIMRFEVLNVKDLWAVGIADKSVRFGRDERPQERDDSWIVYYYKDGQICHIGNSIWGNALFKTGDCIALEVSEHGLQSSNIDVLRE
ncbi:MAG: putative CAMK family protein kinase [Streblomastix strix]|uniref:non-specific serine/threonine protein kinase n=1 Tax=Streblomastix strix TaxID=222440 RepID=A0A5J4WL50_9EUKA|nr:MAG: putative CAMK family protein kinase [Streblomastix strix]